MMAEILTVADLERAKQDDTFHAEVITGKLGGNGADIDFATHARTGQAQKTLPKILGDLDWSYVGLFADGVTFTKKTDFAVDAVGVQWIYTGTLPFSATAGTVPSEPTYQAVHVRSHSALADLNPADGSAHNADDIRRGMSTVDADITELETYNQRLPYYVPSLGNSSEKIGVWIEQADVNNNATINTYKKSPLGFWVIERLVTGRYSGGGSLPDNGCPAWRLGQVYYGEKVGSYKLTYSASSGTVTLLTQSKASWNAIGAASKIQNGFKFNQVAGNGHYLEYDVNEDAEEISILIAGSGSSDAAALLEIRDYAGVVLKSESVNCKLATLDLFIYKTSHPKSGQPVKVRLTKTSGSFLNVGGVNATFDGFISRDIDYISYYVNNDQDKQISSLSGAQNYAVQEHNSLLFGGESHGGESIISQDVYLDDDLYIPVTGSYKVCNSIKVVRETLIDWGSGNTCNVKATITINGSGSEFVGNFDPSVGFLARTWYSPMITVNDSYKEMLMPTYYDATGNVASDVAVPSINSQGFKARGPGGKIVSAEWSQVFKQNPNYNPYWSLKPSGSSSHKYYHGIAVNSSAGVSIDEFSYNCVRKYI